METSNIVILPVGLDVGSRCVRVATGRSVSIESLMERAAAAAAASNNNNTSNNNTNNNTTDASSSSDLNAVEWPAIVVNADGQRWTRAVVARAAKTAEEDHVQHDDDDQHDHYLWGDAAAATISSDATLSGGWIRDLLSEGGESLLEEEKETENSNNNNNNNNNNKNRQNWTNAFFTQVMSSHIPQFQSAAAAAASSSAAATAAATTAMTTTFAVVASVPPPPSSSNKDQQQQQQQQYLSSLTTSIQNALNKTKRRQRKKMPVSSTVIGIMAEPVAIALAYSTYQQQQQQQQQQQNNSNNNSDSNTNNSAKNLLILDGGASGLTWTWLQQAPSPMEDATTTNNTTSSSTSSSSTPSSSSSSMMWCMKHSNTTELVSTRALVTAMAKHVAEQLEQQHRLERNSTTKHARSFYKLQHACEQQVLSRLLSPPSGNNNTAGGMRNWTVHMDGWYQGLDCHVVVSAPRLDHVLSPMQQQTKRMVKEALDYILQEYSGINGEKENDNNEEVTIVLAGSLHAWMKPLVESVLKQWTHTTTTDNNNNNKCPRVQLSTLASAQQLPPEEMAAMGCAIQAQWILTKAAASMLRTASPSTHHAPSLWVQPRMSVWKSPITIGIRRDDDGSEAIDILIQRHVTWLPCQVTHALRLTTASNNNNNNNNNMVTWTLCQLQTTTTTTTTTNGETANNGNVALGTEKALAKLEVPASSSSSTSSNNKNDGGDCHSLTLFLSEQGTLHMTLSGSDQVVRLTPALGGGGSNGSRDDDDDDEEDDEENDENDDDEEDGEEEDDHDLD